MKLLLSPQPADSFPVASHHLYTVRAAPCLSSHSSFPWMTTYELYTLLGHIRANGREKKLRCIHGEREPAGISPMHSKGQGMTLGQAHAQYQLLCFLEECQVDHFYSPLSTVITNSRDYKPVMIGNMDMTEMWTHLALPWGSLHGWQTQLCTGNTEAKEPWTCQADRPACHGDKGRVFLTGAAVNIKLMGNRNVIPICFVPLPSLTKLSFLSAVAKGKPWKLLYFCSNKLETMAFSKEEEESLQRSFLKQSHLTGILVGGSGPRHEGKHH